MRAAARGWWLRLTTTPAQRRTVEVAALLLDVRAAAWYRRVDLGTLDMNSTDRCVLGQVFGWYEAGLRELYGYRVFHTGAPGERAFGGSFPRRLWVAEVRDRVRASGAADRALEEVAV